ncbi:hypothetical protein LQZ19_07025, partial [Treponema primitia]|uniref:hypothetical protein n=1 Tax=Treponema primitia TaxID=88058 RepID=UPI0039805B19
PDGSHFGEIRTDFTVRNNQFKVSMNIVDGNNLRHYSITYVTKGATQIPATALVPGNVYTVGYGGDTRWTRLGAPNNEVGTTFVALKAASTADGTGGTVWGYTAVSGTEKTDVFPGGNPAAAVAAYSGVGDFANIPDSLGVEDTVLKHSRLFILKVYDTTTGGPIAEQLAQAAIFNLDMDNDDKTRPTAVVNPFHWNNKDNNSLYGNSKNNGHIELEADLPGNFTTGGLGVLDRDPKVSGKISIRGSAEDNNILGSLWVYMDGFTFAGAAVTETIYPSHSYAKAADYIGGVLTGADQWDANGWKFTVEPVSHDQAGHKVNWRLDIDTNKIANIAAVDRPFRVLARDFPMPTANTSLESSTQTVAAAKTPYYRMDVVPYIVKISTAANWLQGGLKDDNIRSADGKYSVIQGSNASFINVTGFNLNPMTNGVRILSAALNGTYSPAVASGTILPFTGASETGFTTTNNSSKSGYLAVYVGATVGTLNNINSNASLGSYTLTGGTEGQDQENMPNREADRYKTKNITLTDDRYLQFYTVKETDVRNGYYPTMIMNGNNPVFGYIDDNGGSSAVPVPLLDGSNGVGGAGSMHGNDARPQRTEFNINTKARLYTEYLVKALAWEQMAMTKDDSGRYLQASVYNYSGGSLELIYDRYAELWPGSAGGHQGLGWAGGTTYVDWPTDAGGRSNNANNNAVTLETVGFTPGILLNRYQYPKLISKGDSMSVDGASMYMLYFDDNTTNKDLIFRNFQIGTNVTGRPNRIGNSLATQVDSQNRPYNTAYTNITETTAGTGRLTAASGASPYFDMAVTSDNYVVIVYFDESAGKLKLKYSSTQVIGANPTAAITWTTSAINLPDYVGTYISMAIDSDDHLHIAAFDRTDSDLKYIYIDSRTSTTYKAVTVDQFGAVGNWTQIKLKPGTKIPYIAYYNATETGGRDSIKLAYSKAPITSEATALGGVDGNGYTTSGWEYMTVPALTPPQGGSLKFKQVNLGFTATAITSPAVPAGSPVLGYLGTNIEFSYPVSE